VYFFVGEITFTLCHWVLRLTFCFWCHVPSLHYIIGTNEALWALLCVITKTAILVLELPGSWGSIPSRWVIFGRKSALNFNHCAKLGVVHNWRHARHGGGGSHYCDDAWRREGDERYCDVTHVTFTAIAQPMSLR